MSRAETGWLVRFGTRIHSSLWPDRTRTAPSCLDRSVQADTAVQSQELLQPRPRRRVLRLCKVREEHPAVAHDVKKDSLPSASGRPGTRTGTAEDQKSSGKKAKSRAQTFLQHVSEPYNHTDQHMPKERQLLLAPGHKKISIQTHIITIMHLITV